MEYHDDQEHHRTFRLLSLPRISWKIDHDANFLKGGLVYADAITTVSNTYAEEIKTPFYGEGLDGLMNARSHRSAWYRKRY